MWSTRGASDSPCTERNTRMQEMAPRAKTQVYRVGQEIHFMDDIDYDTVHDLVKLLKEAEQDGLNSAAACAKSFVLTNAEKNVVTLEISAKPILLYLTTHGGSIYAALKVVDVIKSLKVPVHTIASGYVASAGTLLSMAGKKRFITPHTFMLVHELRSSFWGKYSDAREQLGNMDKLMEMIIQFVKDHSKIQESEIKEILSRDRNWEAADCIKNGIVDEILAI